MVSLIMRSLTAFLPVTVSTVDVVCGSGALSNNPETRAFVFAWRIVVGWLTADVACSSGALSNNPETRAFVSAWRVVVGGLTADVVCSPGVLWNQLETRAFASARRVVVREGVGAGTRAGVSTRTGVGGVLTTDARLGAAAGICWAGRILATGTGLGAAAGTCLCRFTG